MKKFIRLLIYTGIFISFSSCVAISDKAKWHLEKPVDCSAAESDIFILESEKKSLQEQLVHGARSVLPVSMILGMMKGEYEDRLEVATGDYNRDIERKIRKIKDACGID